MKKLIRILSYILVATVASVATMAVYTANNTEAKKLQELEKLVQARFIGEEDVAAMEDAAAAAMIAALPDRWSYYLTAEEYAAYLENRANVYVGVGITVSTREDGYLDVSAVEPSGPAKEAGVLPGDVVTAIDGTDIAGIDLNAVKAMVRGKKGTTVTVTLLRDQQSLDVEITRVEIKVTVATGQLLQDNIGLVTITNFDSRCASETIAIIEDLQSQGATALIFDVRYNPGGYKSELVKLLDYLLPEGPLFRSLNYAGEETLDSSKESCLDIPMAVLVNGDSYSAAEFFAAALDEYDAAIVVGEPTTGKGRFQNSFVLSDGSAVVLSVGEYRTPNGVSLAEVGGLQPEILVEVDKETYKNIYYDLLLPEEDPQIQAAVEALKAQNVGN